MDDVGDRNPFVDRPAIEDVETRERVLFLGTEGAGKTRTLAEATRRVCAHGAVEHVVRSTDGFLDVGDLTPLLDEGFTGDVLLVWDDVHTVGNDVADVVRQTIAKLERILGDQGDDLRVFATAGVEEFDHETGSEDDDPVWGEFERRELAPLSEDAIRTLVAKAGDRHETDLPDYAVDALVEQVHETSPTPLFVETVVASVADREHPPMSVGALTIPDDAIAVSTGISGPVATCEPSMDTSDERGERIPIADQWPVALAGPPLGALGTDRSGRSVPPPSGRWIALGVRFAASGNAW